MEWTIEQRELPPLDVTQADMDAEISVPGWKHKGIAGLSSIPGQLLACRERQLTAALDENKRLRSQLKSDDTQLGELAERSKA